MLLRICARVMCVLSVVACYADYTRGSDPPGYDDAEAARQDALSAILSDESYGTQVSSKYSADLAVYNGLYNEYWDTYLCTNGPNPSIEAALADAKAALDAAGSALDDWSNDDDLARGYYNLGVNEENGDNFAAAISDYTGGSANAANYACMAYGDAYNADQNCTSAENYIHMVSAAMGGS